MLELKDRQYFIDVALAQGATGACVVATRDIKVGYWPRWKCQFGCPDYGKSLCCPPRSPACDDTRALLDEYDIGLLVQCSIHFDPEQENWLDVYKKIGNKIEEVLLKVEKTSFLMNYYRAFSLRAAYCNFCSTCHLEGCINPARVRPSAQACGIDIMGLAAANGFDAKILTEVTGDLSVYGLVLID